MAWVLEHIYAIIPNYGIAILVLSLLWMIIIAPLTLKSQRSMLAMQKLQPELKKLQEKHKNDKAAFAQAQMDLFREHGASPWGSCLPMLLPLPVFFALYRVIQGLGARQPKYLSPSSRMYQDIVAAHGHLNAFGMDLSLNAFSHHASVWAALPYWILVLVLAGTGYLQSAMMMSRNPAAAQNPQMRLMKYAPLIFAVFFIRFPAGVLLYYAMSNVCRIVQQDAMYRFDPKVKALVNQEVQEVEAHTQEIDEQDAQPGTKRAGLEGRRPRRPVAAGTGSAPRSRPRRPHPRARASGKTADLGRGRKWHQPLSRPARRGHRSAARRGRQQSARRQQRRGSASTSKAALRIQRDRHPRRMEASSTGPATNGRPPRPGTEPRPQAAPEGWTSHQSEAAREVTGSGMG